jgi:hypothetical protein
MSAGPQNGSAGHAHLNEEWIRKYESKSLAVEDLQAGSRHLSGCGSCRRTVLARLGPVRLPEELADIPDTLHLGYEQISDYIDGKLDKADKQKVEAHTFICASCSREIEALRKLDAQLASPAVADKAAVPKLSLPERMAQIFLAPGAAWKFGLAFGAIFAGVLLLVPAGPGGGVGPNSTRLIHLGENAHHGLSLGGYALIVAGVVYVIYGMLRRR